MPFHYRNMAAVILAATLLMLAGCSSPAEKAQTSLSDIEELQTSVMESFTQLADLENSLQTEFEAALTEDESLSTLSDGSAEVHANIEERRELLEKLSESNEEILSQHEEMLQIDHDEMPAEAFNGVLGSLDSVTESLDAFTESYGAQLDSEKTYFESLGQDDADYEIFQNGIERVNDEMEGTREIRRELDQAFVELEEDRNMLDAQLKEEADE